MFIKKFGTDQYEVKVIHEIIEVTYRRGGSCKIQKYSSKKNWGICSWSNGYHIKDVDTDEVLFGFVGDGAFADANALLDMISK